MMLLYVSTPGFTTRGTRDCPPDIIQPSPPLSLLAFKCTEYVLVRTRTGETDLSQQQQGNTAQK